MERIRPYIILVFLFTLFAGLSLTALVLFSDPGSSTLVNLVLVYVSAYIFAVGVVTIFGYFLRKIIFRKTALKKLFRSSLRQSIVVGLGLLVILFLSSQGMSNPVLDVVVLLASLGIDLFLLGYEDRNS